MSLLACDSDDIGAILLIQSSDEAKILANQILPSE